MAARFVWAVLLLAVAANASTSRIMGGTPVSIEDAPSVVQIDFYNSANVWSQSCAGTLVNVLNVVSAAHCFNGVYYSPETRRVRAGATNRNGGGLVVEIVRAVNHPSYGNLGNDGDISVVRLATPLATGPTIQQAAIMPAGFELPAGVPVTKYGWGRTGPSGDHSETLQGVATRIVDRQVCRNSYSTLAFQPLITGNMICAGNIISGGEDSCADDAGGPMFYTNILAGVISWGNGCGSARFPGVSTRISAYTNWIVETVSS